MEEVIVQPQYVYVLFEDWKYDGQIPLGVYSTKEKGEEAAKVFKEVERDQRHKLFLEPVLLDSVAVADWSNRQIEVG